MISSHYTFIIPVFAKKYSLVPYSMAGITTSKALICFFILLHVLGSVSEARPLTPGRSNVTKGIENLFDEQFIEAIKTGGPSSGGEGHNFPNDIAQTLGGIKNSGPSPGGRGH